MTIQTIPRPSETAHDRPDLEESQHQLDGSRNGKLTTVALGAVVVGAIVAAVIAIILAMAGDDSRSVSDGSWEQAEFRRMLALDQPPVDTSFDTAEEARHNRLNPTGDTSNEEAEYTRHRALAPKSDNSDEVAEFQRMTRLAQ